MSVLEIKHVSKHFGAIEAVKDVSFTLEAGEVIGLMGDNGAGKSTMVKMIAGNFRPNAGSILMDGTEIVMHKPVDARQHGIEIVHQDLALCDNLTAAANKAASDRKMSRTRPSRPPMPPAPTHTRSPAVHIASRSVGR